MLLTHLRTFCFAAFEDVRVPRRTSQHTRLAAESLCYDPPTATPRITKSYRVRTMPPPPPPSPAQLCFSLLHELGIDSEVDVLRVKVKKWRDTIKSLRCAELDEYLKETYLELFPKARDKMGFDFDASSQTFVFDALKINSDAMRKVLVRIVEFVRRTDVQRPPVVDSRPPMPPPAVNVDFGKDLSLEEALNDCTTKQFNYLLEHATSDHGTLAIPSKSLVSNRSRIRVATMALSRRLPMELINHILRLVPEWKYAIDAHGRLALCRDVAEMLGDNVGDDIGLWPMLIHLESELNRILLKGPPTGQKLYILDAEPAPHKIVLRPYSFDYRTSIDTLVKTLQRAYEQHVASGNASSNCIVLGLDKWNNLCDETIRIQVTDTISKTFRRPLGISAMYCLELKQPGEEQRFVYLQPVDEVDEKLSALTHEFLVRMDAFLGCRQSMKLENRSRIVDKCDEILWMFKKLQDGRGGDLLECVYLPPLKAHKFIHFSEGRHIETVTKMEEFYYQHRHARFDRLYHSAGCRD